MHHDPNRQIDAEPDPAAVAAATEQGARRVRDATPAQREFLANRGYDADRLAVDLDRTAGLFALAAGGASPDEIRAASRAARDGREEG